MNKLNINRHNYQEFFLLYTDNELGATEKKDVENFVLLNPDLGGELLMLQQAILKPDEEIVFENKESLLQFETEENFIHPGNFEEISVRYADNELNTIEKAQLEGFIRRNPQYQKEFELIQSLKLTADESIVFPDKELLYRYEKDEKPILFSWARMAAAAIILIVAGLFWLNNRDGSTHPKNMVEIGKDHPNGEVNMASVNKPAKKITVPVDTGTASHTTTPALQPEAVVLSGNNKKSIDQKEARKNKSTFKETIAKEMNVVQTLPGKSKNIEAKEGGKGTEPIAAQIGNDVKEKRETSEVVAGNIDPNKEGIIKSLVDQPAIKNKKGNQADESVTRTATVTDEDENVFLANMPVEKKNSLRGILRKASRLIDKTTSFRNSKKSNLLIGNIEIAFQ